LFYFRRYYHNPQPNVKDIHEFADLFREKIEQALKHNRRKERLTFECRGDVFKFLFAGKGYFLQRWQVLEENDFPQQLFQKGWTVRMNKHGEGMKLHFPVKIRWFISWSPLKYNVDTKGTTVPCKRAPFEKLSIEVIKVAA
jgi:hypothetical protein